MKKSKFLIANFSASKYSLPNLFGNYIQLGKKENMVCAVKSGLNKIRLKPLRNSLHKMK